jgi:pyrophosphatase PpaX
MSIKNILFDLDGTLLDTNRLILESWRHTHMTFKNVDIDEAQILATFGEPLFITVAKLFPDVEADGPVKVYREFQLGRFEEMLEIFPGVQETLDTLYKSGYQLGVVTSRLRESTYRGLNKYGLVPYFSCIITADDCKKYKPDPEPVNRALEKMGIHADETIMVGDSIFDIQCAQNAGVRAAYVAWSAAKPDFGGGTKPDFIVQSADEILRIL